MALGVMNNTTDRNLTDQTSIAAFKLNRFRSVRYIAAVLGVISLGSCVSPLQMALNNSCDRSRTEHTFPKEESIAQIHVQFRIGKGLDQINIDETAVCEYQGSFCPAGEWYDVWYGNQEISREVLLPKNRMLSIWHHGLCTRIDEYRRQCANDKCSAEEHFEFRLLLNPQETKERKEECSRSNGNGVTYDSEIFLRCSAPNVDLVTLDELRKYGYEIDDGSIVVSNEGF